MNNQTFLPSCHEFYIEQVDFYGKLLDLGFDSKSPDPFHPDYEVVHDEFLLYEDGSDEYLMDWIEKTPDYLEKIQEFFESMEPKMTEIIQTSREMARNEHGAILATEAMLNNRR